MPRLLTKTSAKHIVSRILRIEDNEGIFPLSEKLMFSEYSVRFPKKPEAYISSSFPAGFHREKAINIASVL